MSSRSIAKRVDELHGRGHIVFIEETRELSHGSLEAVVALQYNLQGHTILPTHFNDALWMISGWKSGVIA
jgi:hypothetical protein